MKCFACPVKIKNETISLELFKTAVVKLRTFIEEAAVVKLFGGEPLLEFELLLKLISHLREKSYRGLIEIGTNGQLLNKEMITSLKQFGDVQLNINSDLGDKGIFADFKNVIRNVRIYPGKISDTFKLIQSISDTARKGGHRINLLPVVYTEWTPEQIHELDILLPSLLEYIRRNKLNLENYTRYGDIPLFNNAITVDTDGEIYSSDLCMANIPVKLKQKLLFKDGVKYTPSNFDLINVFGIKAVASSYAVGEIFNKYV